MTETPERSSTDRVSLKISLTPEQKFKLGEVAREHHNGNRSALIRSAVYLYERVMERPDDLPAPTQIKATLEELQTDVEQLDSTIDNLPEEMRSPAHTDMGSTHDETDGSNTQESSAHPTESDHEKSPPGESSADASTTDQGEIDSAVKRVLSEHESQSLTLADISEETDYTKADIRSVLNEFVTIGIVARTETNAGESRYSLDTDDAFGVEL